MTLGPDDAPDADPPDGAGAEAGRPRAGQRENRRQEIIQTAFEVFTVRGFRGASLGEVAQQVGLTKAGLLHYFPSKDALLIAVLEERDRVGISIGKRAATAADPVHGRLEGLRAVLAQNASQRGLVQAFTVLSAESVTDGHPAQDYFRARYRDGRRRLAEGITAPGQNLSERDARLAAAVLFAVMDGLQLQWLLDPDEVDMADAFTLFAEAFEQLGFTAPPRKER